MFECPHCLQRTLIWMNDFSFEDYGMEGEGIVQVFSCQNCGADVECYVRLDDEGEEDGTDTGRND